MKIVVAIATTGRPAIVAEALKRIEWQSRAPDATLIVGAELSDIDAPPDWARFIVAPMKGSGAQRNYALDLIGDDADIVVFIDDDYVPAPDFVEGVERLFADHPDVVAASGHLIADGVYSPGLAFDEADALIADYRAPMPSSAGSRTRPGTYGCNMAYRLAAAPHVRFDDSLPLYAWLEDTDFSAQYARVGRVVRTNHFAGVHLGVQVRSHVRRPARLFADRQSALSLRKGTVTPLFALKLAAGKFFANRQKSLRPEPWIDRRGRLRGNLLALGDLLRGRADPRRVLEL